MEYNSSCSSCRGRNGCKIAATARVDSLRAHGSSFPVWTKSITCRIRNCLECGGLVELGVSVTNSRFCTKRSDHHRDGNCRVPQSGTQKHQQDHSENRKTTQTGSNFDNSTGLQQWKRMKWNIVMFQHIVFKRNWFHWSNVIQIAGHGQAATSGLNNDKESNNSTDAFTKFHKFLSFFSSITKKCGQMWFVKPPAYTLATVRSTKNCHWNSCLATHSYVNKSIVY